MIGENWCDDMEYLTGTPVIAKKKHVGSNSYTYPQSMTGSTNENNSKTLDSDLVDAVDQVSKELSTSRSAFTRRTLRDALAKHKRQQLENQHHSLHPH